MLDVWYMFPATIGEDQAWITYNHGYAEVAEADPRKTALRVKLPFKNPTNLGMPTNDEYPSLLAIDEALDKKIAHAGGVYVGRVTLDGNRFFYFYIDLSEEKASEIIQEVSESSSYKLQYLYKPDADKSLYWNELFPTEDDWQVIKDLEVLDSLAGHGDNKDKKRDVMHWAYFPDQANCTAFAGWAQSQGYKVLFKGTQEGESDCLTRYSHFGSMHLGDITSHTIKSNQKATELGGRYDGWETRVETE